MSLTKNEQGTKDKINQIILSKFPEDVIENETDLMEAGMDSIMFIEMIVDLENEFEIEFDANDLLFEEFRTVNIIQDKVVKMMHIK